MRRSRPSLGASVVVTIAGNGLTLVLTLFTGVLTARLLSPDGRGEVAAVIAWASMVQLISSLGIQEAITLIQARSPESAPRVLATTLMLVAVLGTIGVLVSQLLIPLAFSSQREELVAIAQVFMLMSIPIMAWEALIALLNGHHYFVPATLALVGQPLLLAGGLALAWMAGAITVTSVLSVHAGSHLVVALLVVLFLVKRSGIGRPSLQHARTALAFGLRLQGHVLGSVGNARLDMLVMPALLPARSIGLYAVAVSAASIVMPLFASLKPLVVAVAGRSGGEAGMPFVETTLRFTLVGSAIVAGALAAGAPAVIGFVYGPEFLGSVTPLRLLLPGIVLWSGAAIITGALNAVDRPARASFAQLAGLAVTVSGLSTLLPALGIAGAALTSTLAYSLVYFVLLWLLAKEAEFSISRTLALGSFVADSRWLWGHVRRGLRPRATTLPTPALPSTPATSQGRDLE